MEKLSNYRSNKLSVSICGVLRRSKQNFIRIGENLMREHKGDSLLDFPESYTIIDIETTGLDSVHDCIIEVAALKINKGTIENTFSSLVKPNVKIDSFIEALTGISNSDVSKASEPEIVLSQFADFIGDSVLIGHNVNFDINFLYDNFEKYLSKPLCNDYVDTLRLSKQYFKGLSSYKLSSLADFLKLSVESEHRALADCLTANQLFLKIKEAANNPDKSELDLLDSLSFDRSNPFFQKRVVVKGIPQKHSYAFMKAVSNMCGCNMSDIFLKSSDYIIFSDYTYKRYKEGKISEKFLKADALSKAGTLKILSEKDWCEMLNIPYFEVPAKQSSSLDARDIVTSNTEFDETHPLFDKLCVFTGTLEKMARKDAMQAVVDLGGKVANSITKKTNYLILGNNDYCSTIKDGKSSKQKKAESLKLAGNDIEIISENVFYDMISE